MKEEPTRGHGPLQLLEDIDFGPVANAMHRMLDDLGERSPDERELTLANHLLLLKVVSEVEILITKHSLPPHPLSICGVQYRHLVHALVMQERIREKGQGVLHDVARAVWYITNARRRGRQ